MLPPLDPELTDHLLPVLIDRLLDLHVVAFYLAFATVDFSTRQINHPCSLMMQLDTCYPDCPGGVLSCSVLLCFPSIRNWICAPAINEVVSKLSPTFVNS